MRATRRHTAQRRQPDKEGQLTGDSAPLALAALRRRRWRGRAVKQLLVMKGFKTSGALSARLPPPASPSRAFLQRLRGLLGLDHLCGHYF
jgi:hypothetical protein